MAEMDKSKFAGKKALLLLVEAKQPTLIDITHWDESGLWFQSSSILAEFSAGKLMPQLDKDAPIFVPHAQIQWLILNT